MLCLIQRCCLTGDRWVGQDHTDGVIVGYKEIYEPGVPAPRLELTATKYGPDPLVEYEDSFTSMRYLLLHLVLTIGAKIGLCTAAGCRGEVLG